MAVITGISGMQLGDGNGGNIALDINKRVLRILSYSSFSWRTATINQPSQVRTGSVAYQVPEILQAEDYGNGTTQPQVPQSGLIEIKIDTRRDVKYDIETFDRTRMGDMEYVLGMIASGTALAVQNDLNAHFWAGIVKFLTEDTEGKKQNILVPELFKDEPTPEECRAAMNRVSKKLAVLSKTYNKNTMGIQKAEFLTYLDPVTDVNMRNAFWGILNGMEYAITTDLVGVNLGNFKYTIDPMLFNSIPAGTSFSKDKALDTSKFVGVVVHNEAIAMPINIMETTQVINPENANPRFITKYQFGFGIIRPTLVYGLVAKLPA